MAKKQEKEVEKWVTINGARVPIFKDGSIGGPKELRDKLKASKDKKSADKKETESFVVDYDLQKALDKKDAKRAKSHEKYVAKKKDNIEAAKKALKAGEDTPKTKEEAKALVDKYKKETEKPKYYTESELKDEKFRKDALEEMNRYERNWSYYSAKEKKNISPNGVKELRARIKEIENYEKASKANIIKANDDLKEKQIAKNEAEKDAINGKKSNKPKSYAERIVASIEARDNSTPKYKIKDDYENADDYRKGVLRKQFENNSDPYKLRPGVLYTDEQIAYNKAASDNWKKEREKYMAAKEKKANTSTESVKDSYKKLDKPHDVIIERRGGQMKVQSYGEGWEEGYHVEHTDDVGGKFIDKGKVGDYKIGEQVNYLNGNKMKPGIITMAHKYPNGKVDYNVEDKTGDGHNISSNNLAKTDTEKVTKAKPTMSPREKVNSMTEAQLRAMVKKAGLTKQYNMMMNTRPGAYGYSKQLQVLRDLIADYLAVKENKKR